MENVAVASGYPLPVWLAPAPALPPVKALPPSPSRAPRLLACVPDGALAPHMRAYAGQMSQQLAGHLQRWEPTEAECHNAGAIARRAERGYDLLLYGCGDAPSLSVAQTLARTLPIPLMVVRQPRFPVQSILFLVQKSGAEAAVTWLLRLARPGVAITVLPLPAALPRIVPSRWYRTQGLLELLADNSALSQQLRLVAQRLDEANVASVVRLRQGHPDAIVRQELASARRPYDLVLATTDECSGGPSWWAGSRLRALLDAAPPSLFLVPTSATPPQARRVNLREGP